MLKLYSSHLTLAPDMDLYSLSRMSEGFSGSDIRDVCQSAQLSLIGEFFLERRTVLPLSQMPRLLIKAFVAAEDARFFEHQGIDYRRILGAGSLNMLDMMLCSSKALQKNPCRFTSLMVKPN
jgi:SpoVK/Ycf46/Vps4 family AAA+-type ATPase